MWLRAHSFYKIIYIKCTFIANGCAVCGCNEHRLFILLMINKLCSYIVQYTFIFLQHVRTAIYNMKLYNDLWYKQSWTCYFLLFQANQILFIEKYGKRDWNSLIWHIIRSSDITYLLYNSDGFACDLKF